MFRSLMLPWSLLGRVILWLATGCWSGKVPKWVSFFSLHHSSHHGFVGATSLGKQKILACCFCGACHRCPGKYQAMMVFFICPLKIGLPGALPAIEFVAVVPWVKPTGLWKGHGIFSRLSEAPELSSVSLKRSGTNLSFIKVLVTGINKWS